MRDDQEEFGVLRTLEFLRNHLGEPAADIVQGLHDAARAFSADALQRDDITSLICKVGAGAGAADS